MRIIDFLAPYLDGVSLLSERHTGALSLEPYLSLPDGIHYERSREGLQPSRDPVREGRDDRPDVLLLGLLGPDPERYGREDEAIGLLSGLGVGQLCAIVFGYPAPALPVHRLLDALAASGSQLVQLSSLEHQHVHAAAMVARVGDSLVTPRDPFGQRLGPATVEAMEPPVLRRLANEFVLLDFVARNLRAQVFRLGGSSVEGPDAVRRRDELERWTEQARAQSEQARADADAARTDAQVARADAEAARAEVDGMRRNVERLRDQIDRINASTSFRLGRILVGTARHPAATPHLPLDLVRLWRHRGRAGKRTETPGPRPATARPGSERPVPPAPTVGHPPSVDERRRFVAHSAFEMRPRTRPVVAGILTEPTAGALAHDAVVNRVGPNDARLVIERTEPDFLLIETAALGPGQPWAYAGDPAAADRTARMLEAVDQVHSLGRAAVLVRDVRLPAAAGLVPLESRFDLVLDADGATGAGLGWSRGVQLARFHPLGAPAARDPRPLFVGALSPRAPFGLRRFSSVAMAALAELGLDVQPDGDGGIEEVDPTDEHGPVAAAPLRWENAPAVYRARAVGIANPLTIADGVTVVHPRVLEQLACGMALVSGPNRALAAEFGATLRIAYEPGSIGDAVREALRAGPRTAAEDRFLLRTLFERHASPVMLSMLSRRFPTVPDPRARRAVTAVVGGSPSDPASVIESLTHQAFRPAEVLVVGDAHWTSAARDALEAADISTRFVDENGFDLSWSAVGSIATSEWLTIWPTDRPAGSCHLLDLAVGAEISQADVVAYSEQPSGYTDHVDLRDALVRRAFARTGLAGRPLRSEAEGGGLAEWMAEGHRPLSVGPEETAG